MAAGDAGWGRDAREGDEGGGGADLGGAIAQRPADDDAERQRRRGEAAREGGPREREPGELEGGDGQRGAGEEGEGVDDHRPDVDPGEPGGDGGLVVEGGVEVAEEGDLRGDGEPEREGGGGAEGAPQAGGAEQVEEHGAGHQVAGGARVRGVEGRPAQGDVERGELPAEERAEQPRRRRHGGPACPRSGARRPVFRAGRPGRRRGVDAPELVEERREVSYPAAACGSEHAWFLRSSPRSPPRAAAALRSTLRRSPRRREAAAPAA